MVDPNNIEDWYRQEVERLNNQPEEDVWERLSDNLDVGSVWQRLGHTLDKWYHLLWWMQLGYKAVLTIGVLGIAYMGYLYVDYYVTGIGINPQLSEDVSRMSSEGLDQVAVLDDNRINQGLEKRENIISIEQEIAAVNETAVTHNQIGSESVNITNETDSRALSNGSNEATSNESEPHQVRENPAYMPMLQSKFTPSAKKPFMEKRYGVLAGRYSQEKAKALSRFALGATASVRNSWLLTPETFKSLGSQDRMLTDWGTSAGISFAYTINDRIALQMDALALSQGGTQYVDIREGSREVYREFNFNYHQVNLLAKIQSSPSNVRPMLSGNWVGGVYAGYLQKAERVEDGSNLNIREDYRDLDVGIMAGYHLDLLWRNRILISPGIRVQQGLLNTYKGDAETPAYFHSTYHTRAELAVNVFYRL